MVSFLLRSDVISGHEKMFIRFYEMYKGNKRFIDLRKDNAVSLRNIIFSRDKIIISAGYPAQNMWLIFLLKLLGKQVNVYTPFGFGLKYFNAKRAAVKEFVYKFCVGGRNSSFTTCSPEQLGYLQQRFPRNRAFALNNFIEGLPGTNTPGDTKERKIFFVGRIDQTQKNCLFFEKLAAVSGHTICLVGTAEDQDLAARLRNAGVMLYGSSPKPYELISGFDCIVLPSFYEGAALVVLEACHYDIPIILSDCVGNRMIAKNPLLFHSVEEAARLLELCFLSDRYFTEKWKAFRDDVRQLYSREQFSRQLSAFQSFFDAV